MKVDSIKPLALHNAERNAMEKRTPDLLQATPVRQEQHARTMKKRIGATNYRLNIHFNPNATESMTDKIERMIRNEVVGH